MRFNRTSYVIAASTLALIALIVFQVKWLVDARNLIEEQFEQKVKMALCFAVENAELEALTCNNSPAGCVPIVQILDGFKVESPSPFDKASLDDALTLAFEQYDIPLKYEVKIFEKQRVNLDALSPYTCSLNPLEKSDNHMLSITFPGKEMYIFGKLKFMVIASILILLFITSVFIFANYTLLRQKKMSQINKEFFNNMAHEFRTPLTNITLAGSLLAKRAKEPKEKKYLQVVKDESKKLTHQVERVLHLAKLENGEYQLEKENLCPNELIQHVIEGMEIQIKEKNAQVHFSSNEEIKLEGDKFHLSNAFRNLLDNALKYSGHAPQIDISLEKEENGVLIHFQDNGIGIGKKEQSSVFEKYRRINNNNVHNQKGFGLGLSYVKMIVERHQGFIKVVSDLNKGTRFDLFLPVTK